MNLPDKIKYSINAYLRKLEISPETDFLVEYNDEGDLTVKGGTDLSIYTEERVFLVTKKRSLNIKGCNLKVSVYGSQATVITGEILTVDFI